jgi:hypothetical protein
MITFVVWLYLIKNPGPEEAFQNLNKKIIKRFLCNYLNWLSGF